ncbi:V-type ATP synthase subunit E [Clostridium perfringens]|uniref:V-type ATP synthase subunit E n=1 Tax=Clostridium perfringens TaxID=1502 RepID=UPI000706CFAA|nr:V-type ATP synthase subunit E family protein [Clostridium perfringens]ALG49195.1 V-type ATP synthase subunit E [Clostridium perfringens]EJT6533723.1 V-type ATP synthase subunit E [Clostridium perfringens]MDH2457770.1 V-type ATP synthase subunit E family protein [Clostridium perfringens]MDM0933329.1 V-type ATP synthase subunit E family protein [Clostridium perfringens]MDU2469224.1 V-type ATP synthase subunit E family protein [Clostridium perfringens]
MSNLNNLTSKILNDAEEKKKYILADAEAQKDKIISKKTNRAEADKEEIITKANIEAEVKKARIISNAKLSVRNDMLRAKQDVISKVFNEAIEKLQNLSNGDYKYYVILTLDSLELEGTEVIIINEKDKDIFSNEFLEALNKELESKGKKGSITLNMEGKFNGGFILDRNGIQINNTFEALINSLRGELEFEVNKVLFD